MRLQELPALLEREIDFPAEGRAVLDRIGDVRIDGPPADDDIETIGAALGPAGAEETYGSATELQDTIAGSLADGYVGRKYYDDRGVDPDNLAGDVQL